MEVNFLKVKNQIISGIMAKFDFTHIPTKFIKTRLISISELYQENIFIQMLAFGE